MLWAANEINNACNAMGNLLCETILVAIVASAVCLRGARGESKCQGKQQNYN